MISITHDDKNILFQWDDIKNHYDLGEVILNGVNTIPIKIKNRQKLNSEFFIITLPNLSFIISNGLVNGFHNELGTFNGELNSQTEFIPVVKESHRFDCDCH
jgi:hypothetical protein